MSLPPELTRNVADSTCVLYSWDGDSNRLVLALRKELGGEEGALVFRDVGYLALAPRFELASITAYACSALPAELQRAVPEDDLDRSAILFVIEESNGNRYFIVAADFDYVVVPAADSKISPV